MLGTNKTKHCYDRLDTNKTKYYMELARRTLKSVITTPKHLLEIKIKKKSLNSQSTCGT